MSDADHIYGSRSTPPEAGPFERQCEENLAKFLAKQRHSRIHDMHDLHVMLEENHNRLLIHFPPSTKSFERSAYWKAMRQNYLDAHPLDAATLPSVGNVTRIASDTGIVSDAEYALELTFADMSKLHDFFAEFSKTKTRQSER